MFLLEEKEPRNDNINMNISRKVTKSNTNNDSNNKGSVECKETK